MPLRFENIEMAVCFLGFKNAGKDIGGRFSGSAQGSFEGRDEGPGMRFHQINGIGDRFLEAMIEKPAFEGDLLAEAVARCAKGIADGIEGMSDAIKSALESSPGMVNEMVSLASIISEGSGNWLSHDFSSTLQLLGPPASSICSWTFD